MKDFLVRTGRIPINLDLDEILKHVVGNKTRIKYLKEGMVYIISLLTIDNYNYSKLKDGYLSLSNEILQQIIGDKRPTEIIRILSQHQVIEYTSYRKGVSSRKYRLTEKYNTGEFKYIKLSDRIQNKLLLNRQNKEPIEVSDNLKSNTLVDKYLFIFNQFETNNLDIDFDKGLRYIHEIGINLLHRVDKLSKYNNLTMNSLLNYIGRMVNLLNDIHKHHFHLRISSSNHRFHSNITNLNKILRPFLKVNGIDICEVDISSSQPFILSTILNPIFTSSIEDGFNLHTVYQELYSSLINSKKLVPSNQIGNNNYLLGVYLNDKDYSDVLEFTKFNFNTDFYQYIFDEGVKKYPEITKKINPQHGREYIKQNIMTFLFERNEIYRENNNVLKMINEVYPGLYKFIERFHQHYTNRDFSLLLQRTESFLVINNTIRKITEEQPNVPIFSVHDSIISSKNNVDYLSKTLKDTIFRITGKETKVKSIIHVPSISPSKDILDEIWWKVVIKSNSQFNRIKPTILLKNIHTGEELLKKTGKTL